MSSVPVPWEGGLPALVEGKMPSFPGEKKIAPSQGPPVVVVFNIGYIERTISLEIESCHAQRQ